MKTYGGGEGIAPRILNLGTRWMWVVGQWERTVGTHWIGSWVGPKAGLDVVLKSEKLPFPAPNGSRTPTVQLLRLWSNDDKHTG
jgi:hypothetical protein